MNKSHVDEIRFFFTLSTVNCCVCVDDNDGNACVVNV
jgi:hypothetical protein